VTASIHQFLICRNFKVHQSPNQQWSGRRNRYIPKKFGRTHMLTSRRVINEHKVSWETRNLLKSAYKLAHHVSAK
jgi:hypothetical protein